MPTSFDHLLRPSEDNDSSSSTTSSTISIPIPSSSETPADLLVKEFIYIQTISVPELQREDFELRLHGYLRHMLDELGMYFYKATWFCSLETREGLEGLGEEPHRLYTIHFFLFSHKHFTEPGAELASSMKTQIETQEFLESQLYAGLTYDHAHFRSKIMAEQNTLVRSRTFRSAKTPHKPANTCHTNNHQQQPTKDHSKHNNPQKVQTQTHNNTFFSFNFFLFRSFFRTFFLDPSKCL